MITRTVITGDGVCLRQHVADNMLVRRTRVMSTRYGDAATSIAPVMRAARRLHGARGVLLTMSMRHAFAP